MSPFDADAVFVFLSIFVFVFIFLIVFAAVPNGTHWSPFDADAGANKRRPQRPTQIMTALRFQIVQTLFVAITSPQGLLL